MCVIQFEEAIHTSRPLADDVSIGHVVVHPSRDVSVSVHSLAFRLAFLTAISFEEQQLSQPENGRAAAMSKRQVAYLSPRLGVLNNIPFAIPFDVRVGIFRQFVLNDMRTRGFDAYRGRMMTTRVTIRRGNIAQDGFDRLGDVDLKAPIAITFIDQFGNEE